MVGAPESARVGVRRGRAGVGWLGVGHGHSVVVGPGWAPTRRPTWLREPRCAQVLSGRDSKGALVNNCPLTAVMGEATHGYIARLGKWSREVLASLEDPGWWVQMCIVHLVRGPLHRMMSWLQTASQFDAAAMGDLPCDTVQQKIPVVELVTERALKIMDDFGWLCGGSSWQSRDGWEQVIAAGGGEVGAEQWRPEALMALLELACDVFRRICLPTSAYPLKLAWLAHDPPEAESAMRATVCREILDGRALPLGSAVDTVSPLLRSRLPGLLRRAVATGGRLSPELHCLAITLPGPQQRPRARCGVVSGLDPRNCRCCCRLWCGSRPWLRRWLLPRRWRGRGRVVALLPLLGGCLLVAACGRLLDFLSLLLSLPPCCLWQACF